MDAVYQRRFLPSTSMLVAFDAAARTGSFTGAADELNLTQSAISRQVRALETQLDVSLFRRANKKITLTEAGHAYAREIRPALARIHTASLGIRLTPRGGLLNLAILPTFGTRWLMPRLPSFLEQHPDITLSFVTKLSPFDLNDEGIHGAIHFGLPDWADANASFLMREQSLPVAAPAFLEKHPIEAASDLASLPLLHLASRAQAWSDWFAANETEPSKMKGLIFEQFSTAAHACAAGLGVALLPRFLIQNELERDELRVVFETPVPTRSAYYLVIPDESSDYEPALAFKNWLLGAIRAEQAHVGGYCADC